MINCCDPGMLGSPAHFRTCFEAPILRRKEPEATDSDAELPQARTELSTIVSAFILGRTITLFSQHSPLKVCLIGSDILNLQHVSSLLHHAGSECRYAGCCCLKKAQLFCRKVNCVCLYPTRPDAAIHQ